MRAEELSAEIRAAEDPGFLADIVVNSSHIVVFCEIGIMPFRLILISRQYEDQDGKKRGCQSSGVRPKLRTPSAPLGSLAG